MNLICKLNFESVPDVRYSGQITYDRGWTNNGNIRKRNTLFYLVSGEMTVAFSDESQTLSSGDCVLIPADTYFTVSMPSKCSFRYIHFSLKSPIQPATRQEIESTARNHAREQEKLINSERIAHTPSEIFVDRITRAGEYKDRLDLLFCSIDRLQLSEGMIEKRRLDLAFCSVLLLLSEVTVGNTLPSSHEPDSLREMIMWIARHYNEPITLDGMSRRFNFSKQHIIRLFKKYRSQSVIKYINGYRLRKSLEMLTNTDIQIGEIARSLGFCSSYYFSRLFVRRYGVTPSVYREQQSHKYLF